MLDLGCERPADVRVVDDPGVEHVQRRDPGHVRLELAQPARVEHLGAHTVGLATPLEIDQTAALGLVVDATTTLPHTAWSMPWSRQYCTIDVRPAVHSRAFSDPGW